MLTRLFDSGLRVLLLILLAPYTYYVSPVLTDSNGASELSDLASLSIEELMQQEVVTASKKEQKLSEVAESISILTAEDIRRAGVTSIPEARLAGGLPTEKRSRAFYRRTKSPGNLAQRIRRHLHSLARS